MISEIGSNNNTMLGIKKGNIKSSLASNKIDKLSKSGAYYAKKRRADL